MNFTIRTATAADVPVILALIRGLADYERAPDQVYATEEHLRASLFGARPEAEVLLACEGGDALGFAVFFHNYSTWRGKHGLYLEDLFVMPEARGRGMGTALLVELARLAIERGCTLMQWAVLDWNQPSIDFYKAHGAETLDEWTLFRMDAPAMRKLAGLQE
jgi:GNAT superfamily N-acetyltransferase